MQKFYKGRTNNHLSWVMVDATDFATPESAMSAATKIKIYGKLRGATGVNFVSSGTGSLTNDIQHVGASVNGIYTIALAKADLSDASAAWYDQYIVNLSATGAAYQTLVVDGGIDDSTMLSRTLIIVSGASDAASAAQQANSRALVIQSFVSDIRSHVSDLQSDFQSRVPKLVATNSQLSDLASDIKSAVQGITVSLDASNISDIASAVVAALPITSSVSDIYSMLSDLLSDFQSRVPKRVATDSQLSDMSSDIKSLLTIANSRILVAQSGASDAASAAQQANSRALVAQSFLSDIRSHVSDLQSDFQSRVPKAVATNSQLSDLESDVKSLVTIANSRILLAQSMASDAASAAQQANSRILLAQSAISDVQSAVALIPATKLTAHAAAVLVLVVGSGSTTTAVKFSTVEGGAPSSTNDFYNGRVIIFTSGALSGQATSISDYDGASTTATVVALTGAPANTVTAVIV